ncbi:MAG: hypothetical protein K0R76_1661 [Alphaproteobacteria bacterium]|nr:hypothetical protein [Alphaproteobacteria bacterium]
MTALSIVQCSLNFSPLKVRAVYTSPLVGEVAMSASEMAGEGYARNQAPEFRSQGTAFLMPGSWHLVPALPCLSYP